MKALRRRVERLLESIDRNASERRASVVLGDLER